MAEFALPLPMAVIGELVGVPAADRAGLQPHVRAAAKGIEPMLSSEETDAAIAALGTLGEYFAALLDERRCRPGDDLLSSLAETSESDDRLTDDEVVSTAILLFAAGFETTTNLLGNGLLALLTPSRATGGLAAHIPRSLRPPSKSCCASTAPCSSTCAPRWSRRTCRGNPSHGATAWWCSKAQPTVIPARFENPDALDLRRADNVPMSFGWGAHHCIGAPLARMEGEIAFNALLARFPSLELLDAEPHWRPSFTLRGLRATPAGLGSLRRRRPRRRTRSSHSSGGPIADASGPSRST